MNNVGLNRREFMQRTAIGSLALPGLAGSVFGGTTESKLSGLPAVRAITQGPKFHWFSYYDKLQFEPEGRYSLGMEIDFEHRSLKTDDVIKIGMVDLKKDDRWTEFGQSSAWCWQQGCILQWRPGSKDEIIWNDRQDGRFVCHILNVHNGRRRTLPYLIYTISPDGRTAVAPDFRRVRDMRPGYGYAGLPGNKWILNDTYPDKERKQNVYLYNVATGKTVPLGHFYLPPEYKGEWRCDTHPRFSPDGQSVVIDSPHDGNGRQMYLIDISTIVG